MPHEIISVGLRFIKHKNSEIVDFEFIAENKNQVYIMTQRIINIVDLSALQQEYETIVDFAANDFLPNAFATTPNSHTVPSRSATTMCIYRANIYTCYNQLCYQLRSLYVSTFISTIYVTII